MHERIFLARDTRVAAAPSPDDSEDLHVEFYESVQLQDMIDKKQINSLPTIAALLMALKRLDQRMFHIGDEISDLGKSCRTVK